MDYHFYYFVMSDGTVKQVNPFTGTEVWTVPGRWNKPISNSSGKRRAEPLEQREEEDYCAFCATRYDETGPEKARIAFRDGSFQLLRHLPFNEIMNETAVVRRVPNLFEIVSVNYWQKNYSYKLSPKNLAWKEAYLSDPAGLEHVLSLIDYRLKRSGKSDDQIAKVSMEEKVMLADAFFGGGHELVITQKHFKDNASSTADLFSTGDLDEENHYQYFRFIIDTMADIVENNRYVRYISIYKNWLQPAGATFDHLHTQLVAIDEWGERIERQIKMVVQDKNVYNVYGPNFAGHHNLIFAENDYAIAYVGIGHRYPTIEIYSKSVNARPQEHDDDEVRGMSDIVRACHAAVGGDVSVNEEWYYTPFDSIFKMPWHVNIKLRINVPAGFEGGTNIFICPLSPIDLRDQLVPHLYDIRANGGCNPNIRIAEECGVQPNILQYYKST